MKLQFPNYDNSILSVSTSLIKHYGVKSKHKSQPLLDKELAKGYKHIMLILLDGMGVNVINSMLDKDDALRKNLKASISSVFPPTTVAATNTVLLAKPPYESGYVGWVQYFEKEDSNTIVFFNKDFYDEAKDPVEDLKEKYLNHKQIYTLIKEMDSSVVTTELFPAFREDGSATFKEETLKALELTKKHDKTFSYLYWIEPDLTEHVSGITSDTTRYVLKDLSDTYQSLINSIDDETLTIVIADHGLIDIEEVELFRYQELLGKLKRLPSIEPRATSFFVKDEEIESFKVMFNKNFEDKFKLYSHVEFLNSGLLGSGTKHPMLESFIGDYMAVAIDKYMFKLNKGKEYISHHAGLSEDEMMVPLIMYSKK
jgi:hypothetical protein